MFIKYIEYVRGIFYKPGFITTIKLLLRRTLVLKNKLELSASNFKLFAHSLQLDK